MLTCSRATQALAAVTVAGALALSGCGASDDAAPATTAGTETRTVTHAHGETEVPADPQRVVVLEPVALDTSVALGAIPVGAAVLSEETGVPAYLGEAAQAVEPVGTVPEPGLERIAALEPDLIIGTETRHSALYDRLSEIAPTVFIASQADPWQDNVAQVAEALGDPEGAAALLEEYQARCDEVAELVEEGTTAQLIRPRDNRLTLYGPLSFAGSTLECAGFTTPEHAWEDISLDLSPEEVREAEADLVLVTTTDVDDPSSVPEAISANADVFDDVHLVDRAFWITGVGPFGGQTVLDDLEAIITDSR